MEVDWILLTERRIYEKEKCSNCKTEPQGHLVPDDFQYEGKSAELVQCGESFQLYRSGRAGDCDVKKCGVHEHEEWSGIFAGYVAESV